MPSARVQRSNHPAPTLVIPASNPEPGIVEEGEKDQSLWLFPAGSEPVERP